MGRPTKYSDEVAAKIAEAINAGATKRLAAAHAGVSYDTLNDWEHGKKGIPKSAHVQFVQLLAAAESRAAIRKLARIEKAGNEGDWRADAWWLERRMPEEFGKSVVDVNQSGAIRIEVVYANRSPDPD